MATIIQIRRDTAANFLEANPILAQGEPALEIDTTLEKIGNGITPYNDLPYRFQATSNVKTLADAWGVGGMDVRAYATNYPILTSIFTALAKTVTLDAADTENNFRRQDAIVADATGDILVIPGTPGLIALPPFVDTDLYYLIRNVLILPNATEPVDPVTLEPITTDLTLFAEFGTEAGGESTVTFTEASVTIASDATMSGTKCIRAQNAPRTGPLIKFTYAAAKPFSNFTALNFDFKSDEAVLSQYLIINFYNGTARVGGKNIFNGQNGYNAQSILSQNINIPKEELALQGDSFTYIEIRPRSYSSAVTALNYRIDNVKLLDGFTANPNLPVTQIQANFAQTDPAAPDFIKNKEYLALNPAGFNNNLAPTDNTLQKIVDKVDGFVLGGEASAPPVDITYENIAALIAGQGDQQTNYFYKVTDASDDPDIDSGKAIYEYLGTTNGTLADYELIWKLENDVVSGSELPSTGLTQGLYFRLDKVNRKILMQYNGTGWDPIRSFGEMTIWVNPAGTDNLNFGDGPGAAAFKTIAFAITQIPPQFYGDVNVIIQAGTYNEEIHISGKNPVGDFKLKITGEYNSENCTVSSVSYNSTEGECNITDNTKSWVVNTHKYKMCLITSGAQAGSILPIISNTSTQIICASYQERSYKKDSYEYNPNNLFGTISNGVTFEILDLTTIINGIITSSVGYSIYQQLIKFNISFIAIAKGSVYTSACQIYITGNPNRFDHLQIGEYYYHSCSIYSDSTALGLLRFENNLANIITSYLDYKGASLNLRAWGLSAVYLIGSKLTSSSEVSNNAVCVSGNMTSQLVRIDLVTVKNSSVGQRFTNAVGSKITSLIVDASTYGSVSSV